ncbi:hypothetical protein SAMN04487965_0873 [Microbulbifer donghaiensis]|uniref:Uncharacterized protein n=1 Tax=Microbulbifer donghaiensis TaxID=494016 RepID=A0A1M4X5T8_9GAMM|nr:hypothetical protein SAMN04487965_0873 [Microbulbifer donghaiensis]
MPKTTPNRAQRITSYKPCLSIKVKLPEDTVRRLDALRAQLAKDRGRSSVSRSVMLALLICGA